MLNENYKSGNFLVNYLENEFNTKILAIDIKEENFYN